MEQSPEELRSAFGHQRWAVFGHSFGAALALTCAATHPESVSALVWCAGTGPDWPRHRAQHRARARARLSVRQCDELDRLSALGSEGRSWPQEVTWRTSCWLPDHPDPAAAAAEVAAFAATPLKINHMANAAFNAELDARAPAVELAECARVRAPVLVISGDEDPRPGDGAAQVAAAVPHGEHVVLEGAGHLPWSERPEPFAHLLRGFLAATA